jgi:pimeloyl-ACP methyl ester carboxylesterase
MQGVSGGGPYALACAHALPASKLACVTIVCGLGPVSEIGMRGARWVNWLGFAFGYRYAPSFLNRLFWRSQICARVELSKDERLASHMREFANPKSVSEKKDQAAMTDEVNARRFLRSSAEAFAQGYDGALQDGKVLSSMWGFRIEDIRSELPMDLWYGRLDVNVPLNHGETIARRLSGRVTLRVEEETHASIFFNWREEFLLEMVRSI